jgi:predicted Rossmann fold nucleotide-binding protein DprA/Smf involved in DNA uptake
MIKEIALALTSHALGEGVLRKAVWRDLRSKVSDGDSEALLEWANVSLTPQDAASVEHRLGLLGDATELVGELAQDGIQVVTEFDAEYPKRYIERLNDSHPSLLFVAGDVRYLSEPLIGIVGSRDVDDAGSEFAVEVAIEAARLGYGVVSGGARGVDKTSMRAAYDAGAVSVGILADSLLKTVRSGATQEAMESGKICLASPYAPSAGFSVGNAMGRNKLIYALSDATVVVAATEGSGGTWAGAVEAIEKSLCPVLVWEKSEVAGALVSRGAKSFATAGELADAIESAAPSQGSLL